MNNYDEKVLIGNWCENRITKEDKDREHLERQNNIARVRHTMKCLLKPEYLNKINYTSDMLVKYGHYVQIVNPGRSIFYSKCNLNEPRPAYTLSLGITNTESYTLTTCYKFRNLVQKLLEEDSLEIVGSTNLKASARNVFKIEGISAWEEGEALRYGQPIRLSLQLGSSWEDQPARLYLASDLGRLGQHLTKPGALPLYLEYEKPTFASEWRIEAEDPQKRLLLEGQQVKFNERILIKHNRTNKALALEMERHIWTMFGKEVDISVNTYMDSHKAELDINLWSFTKVDLSAETTEETHKEE